MSDPGNGNPAVHPVTTSKLSSTEGVNWVTKIILLVDSNSRTRDSRSKAMRQRGVAVDCVATARAALVQFASTTYNLVLIDMGQDVEGAEGLAHDLRRQKPSQRVAFFVDGPRFLATSLKSGRPRAVPIAVVAETPVESNREGAAPAAFDFGQKIRDAEAANPKQE